MTTWLTSDTHLGHRNIARYCGRPPDHEWRIVQGWQRALKPGDTLVHLGDFCFKSARPSASWFAEIPRGVRTVLVEGNHDRRGKALGLGWGEVVSEGAQPHRLRCGGLTFAAQHRPPVDLPAWADAAVFGHVHERGTPVTWERGILRACLCVELWDYSPVSLESLCRVYWSEMERRWG